MVPFLQARKKMLLLMLGGALGTYLRYLVGKWFNSQPWAQGFPYGTLFINVTGSFILGAAAMILLERLPPEHQNWYLLIGTGFCGGGHGFQFGQGACAVNPTASRLRQRSRPGPAPQRRTASIPTYCCW